MEKRFTLAVRALLAGICTLTMLQSQAQTAADYSFSAFQGTYTPISGGVVLGNATSDDQRFVDATVPLGGTGTTGVGLPIGFNFVFAGNTFDRFAINNNGWISFGNSALTPAVNINSSSSYNVLSATSTATPTYLRSRVAGLARDIQAQGGSELRYETVGTAPNRQLVVQWTNYRKWNSTGDTLNFQIVLNETSNVVQVVYGQMLNNATSGTAHVGLGGTLATEFNNRAVVTDWTASTPGAVNTATCNISNTMVLPSGYTYQWTPLTCGANTGLTISAFTTTGATATWVRTVLGSPASLNWQVVPQGNAPGVGVVASGTVSIDTAIITGLNPATAYTFYVQADCGANGLGNYTSANFLTNCLAFNVPWTDDMETSVTATGISTAAPMCWANSLTTGTSWRTNTAAVRNGVGARSGNKYAYATWSSVAWLFTPGVNLDAGTSYEFSFWYNNTDVTNPGHTINIRYGDAQAGGNMTNPLTGIVNPTNTTYSQYIVNFTPASTGVYYFGLQDSTTSSTPWYLVFDDFQVQLTPPCPAPTAVSVDSVSDTEATISWTSLGLSSIIEYGPTGFTQGAGTTISGLSSPYTLTGLMPQTGYDFYLIDTCNIGLSASTSVGNFTTLCSPQPYPGNGPSAPIVVASFPFTDTLSTATNSCYTDVSPLRDGADIFLQFTADSCANSVTVSLCGSSFDTYLYFRDAANTTTIAENDDACGLQSQYTLSGAQLIPGETYLVILEPYGSGDVGDFVINITQTLGTPAPELTTVTSGTTCPNSSDGGAEVLVTAVGKTPLSYVWGGGQTTSAVSGLAPGDYFVTVTNGCGGVNSTTATVYTDYEVYEDVTDVSCNAGNNGSIDLTLFGQTSPVFAWSSGQATEDIATLTAGVYGVTITDGACLFVDSFEVFEPSAIALNLDTVINVNCNGDASGAIEITSSGGSQFSYNQTVTASGGSLGSTTTLTFTGTPQASVPGVVTFSAIGDIDGNAGNLETWTFYDESNNILAVIGGSGNFNDQCTVNPLTVTVNLSPAQIAAWTANGFITFTAVATANVSLTLCGNDFVGAEVQYASGFDYLWSNGATTEDVSGLIANTYTVTLTDANSCQFVSQSFTVSQPTALIASLDSSSNVTCFGGANGAAYVTVSGGTAPYDYNWTGGSTDEDPTSLAAGTYSSTVSDANGCVATSASVTLTEPTAIVVTVDSINNTQCSNSIDGAIYVTISGGTSPYTNVWSNGVTFEDLVGVYPDTYTNTITDAAGCIETSAPATITSPPAVVVTVDSTFNVSCNAGTDGSLYTTLSGGTAPLSIVWNNGDTTTSLVNLPAGSYTPTITDANACQYVELPVDITEPAAIATQLDSLVTVKCNGDSNGEIFITVSGGVGGYAVTWSNSATTEDISGLPAGTYTPSVVDGNNCAFTGAGIVVTEPAVLAIGVDSVVSVSCNGLSDGAIYITVTGGTSPYTPSWSGGINTEDLTNLADGTYVGTITDANGCTLNGSPIVVTEPAAITVSVDSVTNVKCNGGSTGCVSITTTGGTTPYTFLWNNNSTTEDICNLAAGPYTPTVTDANGCVFNGTASSITQPAAALTASSVSTDAIQGSSDGAINLTPAGGTSPYTFDWSTGAATEDLSGLSAGVYTCTISDANGCSLVVSDTVSLIIGISNIAEDAFAVNVYPNPAQNHVYVDVALTNSTPVIAEVYSITGQVIQTFVNDASSTVRFDLNFDSEAAGMYYLKLTANGQSVTKRIVVTK